MQQRLENESIWSGYCFDSYTAAIVLQVGIPGHSAHTIHLPIGAERRLIAAQPAERISRLV
jgi:hypothetical protein